MKRFTQPKFGIEKLRRYIENHVPQTKQVSPRSSHTSDSLSSPAAWPSKIERKENQFGIRLNIKGITINSNEKSGQTYIECKNDVPILKKDPITYKNHKQKLLTKPIKMSTVSLNVSTTFFEEESHLKSEVTTPKYFQRSILSRSSVFRGNQKNSGSPPCLASNSFEKDLLFRTCSLSNSNKKSLKSFSFHRKTNSFGGENVKSLSKGGGFMAAGPLKHIKVRSLKFKNAALGETKEEGKWSFQIIKNPIFPAYKVQNLGETEDEIPANHAKIHIKKRAENCKLILHKKNF
ncbi:unnamed protein product [Blepharisma stoltei]|uniref:Uncharacterized protein n=1 Tax=Blepharisma stoltei TaxID=1481888 RepID=A0AAU9JQ12_9CILI|nr:unnamed protein product [Blepharisma stoltei]